MKKPEQASAKKQGKHETSDEAFAKKFPTLLEFLTTAEWEDGTARETSTLTVFIEDGAFKVAVNDRDLKQSIYLTGKTLQDALGAAERALGGGTADWRAWSGKKRK